MSDAEWIAEFKEKYFSLNPDEREEAIKLKDKHLPDKLYCYVRVGSHFEENITGIPGTDGKLHHPIHLTHPSKFNDPYDTLISPELSYPLRQYISKILKFRLEDSVLKKYDYLKISKYKLDKLCDDFLDNGTISCNNFTSDEFTLWGVNNFLEILPAIIQEYNDDMSRYGIKSFSTKFDSMLMWSHYSDSHKGFCFEYDISQLPPDHEVRKYLYPVIYEDDLGSSNLSQIEDVENPSFIPLIFVERSMSKSSEWAYENEWRFIKKWHLDSNPKKQNELALYPFPITPSKVYIGCKTSPEDLTTLMSHLRLGNPNFRETKFERMGLGINSYKLVHHPEWR